jgi:HK97 gp10 family phage protein
MSIEIRGMDEVLDTLEKIGISSNLQGAVKQACAIVEKAAKQKAPKGSGELRRSITSKVEASVGNIEGMVYTPLEYAPYVEYGTGLFAESGGRSDVPWSYQDDKGEWHSTSGMKPHPYMRPAFEENREAVVNKLKEGLLE